MRHRGVTRAALLSVLFYCCSFVASARPICASAESDPDGDGFGWESGESCLVESTTLNASTSRNDSIGTGDRAPVCRSCLLYTSPSPRD